MTRVLTEEQKAKQRLRQKKYRERNKEKTLLASKKWNKANKEKINKAAKRFYEKVKNDEDFKKLNASKTRNWAARNPEKVRNQSARKRATKVFRVPSWLNEEHKKEILTVYKKAQELTQQTGIVYHVDHIVPLRGKCVSGLHVPWNLRIVTASENMAKSNKLTEFING
jgi:hypothetical protein